MAKMTTESLLGQIQALEAVVCGLVATCPNVDLLKNVVGSRVVVSEAVNERNENQAAGAAVTAALHRTVDGMFSALPGQTGAPRRG